MMVGFIEQPGCTWPVRRLGRVPGVSQKRVPWLARSTGASPAR